MKPLKISFIALIGACVFLFVAAMYQRRETKPQIIGNYTFVNSYGKLIDDNKIILDDGKNKISLVMKDGNWRVVEKNMYFADYNMVNFLISAINRSRIKNSQAAESKDFEFVPEWNISIYNGDKLLDEVVIKKSIDGKYLGKIGRDDKIYELSGYFDFPHDYESWLVQPLAAIKADDVYEVKYGNDSMHLNQNDNNFVLSQEDDKNKLLAVLSLLAYLDFFNVENVTDIKEKTDVVNLSVELVSGLIYDFEFYKTGDRYFAELKLNVAAASDLGIRDYIEQNNILYKNWAFELTPEKYEIFSALK